MANSTIMELGYAVPFLWVLRRQPESPCEGRRTWRIKEFLCSPEIISITSVRGWREHNLLIPTFLKIDLVTGRFSLSQRNRCVVESLLLHQKCWHSISSSAKILFAFPWVISRLCQRLWTCLWVICGILMDFTELGLPYGTWNGAFSSSGNSLFCQVWAEFSHETTVSNGHFWRPSSVSSASH